MKKHWDRATMAWFLLALTLVLLDIVVTVAFFPHVAGR